MNFFPTINTDEAEQAMQACLDAALASDIAVTVAVVDAAGALLALRRMEGARPYTIDLASRKARTAAAVGIATSVLEAMQKEGQLPSADIAAIGGGLPLMVDKACAGAIGVSGSTTEYDQAVAKAGLAVLSTG